MTESAPAAPRRSAPELFLRVPTDDDAAAWFQLFNDPVVMQYISGGVVQPEEWYLAFVSRQQALAAATGVCLFALVVPADVGAAADAHTAAAAARCVDDAASVRSARAAVSGVDDRLAGPQQASRKQPVAGPRLVADPQLTADPRLTADQQFVAGQGQVSGQQLVTEQPLVAGQQLVADPRLVAGQEQVAGFVGLQPWTRSWGPVGRTEIGWRLGVAFQGRGLATAGAQAALERGRAVGIESPIAVIDLRNAPSIGVATKLGMSCADEFDAPDGHRVGMWTQ